jgi:hypothetical protein
VGGGSMDVMQAAWQPSHGTYRDLQLICTCLQYVRCTRPHPPALACHRVPFESLLRGVLASHAFDIDRVKQKGIGLRLTRSSVRGVRLIHFDMTLQGQLPAIEGMPSAGVMAAAIDPNSERGGGELGCNRL